MNNLATFLCILHFLEVFPHPFDDDQFTRQTGSYRKFGIATDNAICGEIGRSILSRNGSVVDAGIAVLFCNGVVDQAHVGLGGGTILLVHARPKNTTDDKMETVYLSADDRAPSWVDESVYDVPVDDWPNGISINDKGDILSWNSFRNAASGVPGELMGYYEAWKRYGLLPWSQLVMPSVRLAREGFRLTESMAEVLASSKPLIRKDEQLSKLFFKAQNVFHNVGDTLKDPTLANTLEEISNDPMSFYNGNIADKIINDLHDIGGRMTKEDLATYRPRILKANTFTMNGYNAHVPPQPFTGNLLAFVYHILEQLDLNQINVSNPKHMELFYHRYFEAWKFAYGHLNCFGDGYVDYDICKEITEKLLDKDYASHFADRILDEGTLPHWDQYSMFNHPDTVTSKGTSHTSILARDGTSFQATSSVNSPFGCGKKGVRTGIIFNDRLTDFSKLTTTTELHTNSLKPDRQGRSFRVPLLLTDDVGHAVLALGGSGGNRISAAVLHDAIFHIHFNKTLNQAINSPRMFPLPKFPLMPILTDNFPHDLTMSLKSKGHDLSYHWPSYGYTAVVQGVSKLRCSEKWHHDCNEACIEAVSDYRKHGKPSGG